MNMEQPKVLTPEEQVRIEEERAENQKRFEGEADVQNRGRSIGEKLLGQNKVSAVDMAHEEALRENATFDREQEYRAQDQARRASEEESFVQEMAAAEKGELNLDQSRFKGDDLEYRVHGKDSEGAERARKLAEINNAALDRLFEQESRMIQSGQWNPGSSALYGPGFSRAEVNELKYQKNERFERLKSMYEEQMKAAQERQKQETLKALTENFSTEKAQIDGGTWTAETSYIRKISFDVTVDRQVSATARRMFDELAAYESKIISDTERSKVNEAYRKEEAQANEGKWVSEQSYFSTIQKDPRFQKFDLRLREDIQRKLVNLMGINLSGGWAKNDTEGNTEGSGDSGNRERSVFPEKRARIILNLDSNVTYEDAKTAYRKFMMQNHPDRNPGGVSKEVEEQIRELTQVWPILEERLKKQSGAKV